MKRLSFGFSLCVLILFSVCSFAQAGAVKIDSTEIRVNVGVTSNAAKKKILKSIQQYNGRLVRDIKQTKNLTFIIPKNKFLSLQDTLIFNGWANYFEEDVKASIALKDISILQENLAWRLRAATLPNDPSYPDQWGLPCIGAEQAWNVEQGNASVIVAIIDTGVEHTHPDLSENVDTSLDYDYVNNDDDATDDNGHGTHVAGIIAAEIDNMLGIAGLQQVTIMALKGLDADGSGFTSDLAQAVIDAADGGANVINMSFGGILPSSVMRNACQYAFDAGVVLIAAAGNEGWNLRSYPAAYPTVAGVAALEDCTTRVSWSNYGYSNVKISAPGVDILSTYLNGGYAYASGTSMATPMVAGVVAAYFSYDPALTNRDILSHMAANADDLGTLGVDVFYGYGRVDIYPFD